MVLALVLTFVGALAAQVNVFVLRYAVDSINSLVLAHKNMQAGMPILITITTILIVKEVVNVFIQFGQKFFGEKIRNFIDCNINGFPESQSATEHQRNKKPNPKDGCVAARIIYVGQKYREVGNANFF